MASRLLAEKTVMVLGGAGLVGNAIVRRLALLNQKLRPRRIIVASRFQEEALEAVAQLQNELLTGDDKDRADLQSTLEFVPEWGDVFVRSDFAHVPRQQLLKNSRSALLADLYDQFDNAYENNYLVHLLRRHRPHILVDSINTATGLSYQNLFDAAFKVRQALQGNAAQIVTEDVEMMLLSQSVPSLVRHVQILAKVAAETDLEQYMKIGTTGTGGMGLNLPYTHSETRPSNLILAKNEAAFGQTGLLFLWAQTPGAPAVHEIKPGAAIGFRNIGVHKVSDRYGNHYIRKPRLIQMKLDDTENPQQVNVREDESQYPKLVEMTTVAVDLGENGLFTADEFRTLSAPGSMELISPEEISEVCVQELLGMGTGHNVLSSIRGAVLSPGYRAGTLRPAADHYLTKLSRHSDATIPSIALGRLGPPLLSKILFEAHILDLYFGQTLGLQKLAACDPAELSRALSERVLLAVQQQHPVESSGTPSMVSIALVAPTIGVPIVVNDNIIIRGPNITEPEPIGHQTVFTINNQKTLDTYAQSGWVDLRETNIQIWKDRAQHILAETPISAKDTRSLTKLHYGSWYKDLNAAALAAWILAGEVHGQRDLN